MTPRPALALVEPERPADPINLPDEVRSLIAADAADASRMRALTVGNTITPTALARAIAQVAAVEERAARVRGMLEKLT